MVPLGWMRVRGDPAREAVPAAGVVKADPVAKAAGKGKAADRVVDQAVVADQADVREADRVVAVAAVLAVECRMSTQWFRGAWNAAIPTVTVSCLPKRLERWIRGLVQVSPQRTPTVTAALAEPN
jgi:hypothetical protein